MNERRRILLRAEAARELIRAGELSPETALYFTVWPSPALEGTPVSRRARMSAAEVARARELRAQGFRVNEIARRLGRSHGAVGAQLRRASA